MANLKTFSGFPIQNLSSDPVPFAQAKINDPYAGTWASGGAMNTGRAIFGATGTQTAGLAATGQTSSGNNGTTNVELYDGSSWTETTNVNTARRSLSASGASNTDSLIFGGLGPLPSGSPSPSIIIGVTEKWNGSAWTEVSDLNTSRFYSGPASLGTSTATLAFGGATPPGVNSVESWDGSSWTETTEINTARSYIYGLGVQTSAIAAAGYTTTTVDIVESWNGSSWTEVAEVNSTKHAGGSAGSSTDGIIFGGSIPGATAQTESWNGSVWTEVNDLAAVNETIRGNGASGSVAWAAGGDSFVTTTQEWAFSGIPPTAPAAGYSDALVGQMYYNSTSGQFKAIKEGVGSWASGGNLNGGRYGIMGAGTLTAGLAMGGTFQPSDTTKNTAETYDGTSWTNAPTMPGNRRNGGSWGVQTSAVVAGGSTSPGATPLGGTAFEFDGSSFSNGGSLNTARRFNTAAGSSSTAGITWGGGDPGTHALTESYDGSSWTEVNDLNTARWYMAGNGTQTAAIAAGGNQPPPSTANVELWNGTNWTETTELNTARNFSGPSGGMGSSTAAIVVSGDPNNVESWDGTSWTEIADLGTGRGQGHTVGYASTSTGLYFGGTPNSYATYTEEWDQPDFTINPVTTS